MKFEDRVGDYLEYGTDSGADHIPDGAVQVRRLLGSETVWEDPPPAALEGVLRRIREERTAGADAPVAPSLPDAPTSPVGPVNPGPVNSTGPVKGTSPPRPRVPAPAAAGPAADGRVVPLRPRSGIRRFAAAAVAAAVFALGGTAGWVGAASATGVDRETIAGRPGTTPPQGDLPAAAGGKRIQLSGTDLAPGVTAVALVKDRPSGVAISLEDVGLKPAKPGTYYQAWVKPSDGQSVSIGSFHMRDKDTVELWAGVDVRKYHTVTVTLQTEGSGPDPSDKVLLRGEI